MTLCEAFQASAARDPSAIALRAYGTGVTVTWGEYADHVRTVAAALHSLGVRRRQTVALMMASRPEFHIADTAAIHLGAVAFSMDCTSSPSQVAYMLANSGAKVAIVDSEHAGRVLAGAREFSLDAIVCVDGSPPGTLALSALHGTGLSDTGLSGTGFEAAWRAVQPDDLVTIVYTEGAGGPPKGVELSHANVLAQAEALASVYDLHQGDIGLSCRPLAHITDRLASHYIPMLYAADITCVAGTDQQAAALAEVRPTYWMSIPRVFEKMRVRVEESARSEPRWKRWLWQAARTYPHGIADPLVLRGIRRRIGLDRARFVLCGAEPLATPVLEFFRDLGVPLYETWGMSETAGIATANPPGRVRTATAGVPLPNVQTRLSGDGELLVRGPIVARGYRNDPERTAAAFDADGWLHTGDVAAYDDHGYLKIMSPAAIESALRAACPLIDSAVVVGHGRHASVALIVVDEAVASAMDQADADRLLEEGIAAANEELSRADQIRRYAVLDGPWEPGGDELTPTLKPRRSAIEAKYATTIQALYAEG